MEEDFIIRTYNDSLLTATTVHDACGIAYALQIGEPREYLVERFMSDPRFQTRRYKGSYDRILSEIKWRCFRGSFLAEPSRPEDCFVEIPVNSSEVRLIYYPTNNQTAIIGGGGIKNIGTATTQDSADLAPQRLIMIELNRRFIRDVEDEVLFVSQYEPGVFDQYGFLKDSFILRKGENN